MSFSQYFATIEMQIVDDRGFEAMNPVHHSVTTDIREDEVTAQFVEQQLQHLDGTCRRLLAHSDVERDGLFVSSRTRETSLGNFVCDSGKFSPALLSVLRCDAAVQTRS